MMCCLAMNLLAQGQSQHALTLQQCYTLANQNYPLVKQMALIEKTSEYSLENASRGFLPQVSLNGQITYQSEVIEFPISSPDVAIPALRKDQYKIYAEVSQSLTDAHTIKQQKELLRANTAADQQNLEVALFQLKERINQLFFGILLLDAQLEQTEIIKTDIRSGIKRANASIANGTALKSSADILQAELLKTDQRTVELQANRKGYADMLALFIGQTIEENTVFQTPPSETIPTEINRPELKLYDLQQKSFEIQDRLITARNIPRLSFFLQGGYGRPTLNVLTNEFGFYYIGGLRLGWNLSGFYTSSGERQLQTLNRQSIAVQRETFLFNTNLSLRQQNAEIVKLQQLMTTDDQIIALREKVKETTASQLENGTITTTDYLTNVNAEDQARQNLLLHKVQLLMAQYNYKTTSGN